MNKSLSCLLRICIILTPLRPLPAQDGGVDKSPVCYWPPVTIALPATEEKADKSAPNDASDVGLKPAPVPWKLLDFHGKRKVTRIRLVFFKFNENDFDGHRVLPDLLDITSADSEVIRVIQMGLDHATRPAAERDGFGAGGDWPIGQLQVCTTNEVIVIAIHKYAFGLHDQFVNTTNTFWSWTLAKEIEELYFHNTDHHLPDAIIEGLSGEKWVQIQKKELLKQKDELKN